MKSRFIFAVIAILASFLFLFANVSADSSRTSAPAKRYIVTCNHHYDNQYNTLGKYASLDSAVRRIRKVSGANRGQWYVYDAMEKKIAWPDLGTESKKIRKAVAWAEAVACDNRHGYSTEGEAAKDGCSLRWPRWGKKGDYSCSTVLAMAFELFDFYSMRKNAFEKGYTTSVRFLKKPFVGFSSRNVVKVLKHSTKFRDISSAFRKSNCSRGILKPGDVVVTAGMNHTAMITNNHCLVQATCNESKVEYGRSRPGDQTGSEIYLRNYLGSNLGDGGIWWVFRPIR